MSHLLSRLAERAMGMAPTIEPVRSPMFGGEPAVGAEATGHEPADFFYGDIVSGTQAARPVTSQTVVRSTDTPASSIENGGNIESPTRPAPNSLLHEPLSTTDQNGSKKNSSARRQDGEFFESAVVTADRAESGSSLNVAPGSAASGLSPVTSQLSQSIDSVLPRDERDTAVTKVVTERSTAPAPPVTETAESNLRPRDFTLPSFTAQDIVDRLPHESRSTPAPLPTIKVNIGRIDVRAVTTPPAPAPRQRKKTQPSLSLDDYLKQRAGGRR